MRGREVAVEYFEEQKSLIHIVASNNPLAIVVLEAFINNGDLLVQKCAYSVNNMARNV